jgi:uncharacterized protein YwgA
MMPFSRREIVLAGLSALGTEVGFYPVQVQKLFFLIDQEAYKSIGGPHFDFKPYNYGPFDKDVYETIEDLAREGMASIGNTGRYRVYAINRPGLDAGRRVLERMDNQTQQYIKNVAKWVSELTFDQIVSSIYARYPKMKENSIFAQ